ncbi:hypothetical protein BCR44DRAFT_1517142 [Catenaria anguillulae PL171]|uniref:Uncharacterized protein n=1 Tax=Catenaria anguillulae PL171 TaxID=765915 RepID=A0A1Y2H6U7_9FUNG|nr:hypothetical protein BCR44DRAFT_1517142 [Catenaria anguillulae PL171]
MVPYASVSRHVHVHGRVHVLVSCLTAEQLLLLTFLYYTYAVQWIFRGNMNANAIAIGDVDNDGLNEVVVASIHGQLSVFKYLTGNGSWPNHSDQDPYADDQEHLLDSIDDDHAAWCCSPGSTVPFGEPWLTASGLGSITSLSVGDIASKGHNSIVAVSAEGSIHVFNVQLMDTGKRELVPVLCTPAPLNVCRMLIADVDGDGTNELVLARTDRQVYVFQIHLPATYQDGPAEQSLSSQASYPTLHAKTSNILAAAAANPALFSSPSSSASSTISGTIRSRRRTITAPPIPLTPGDSAHLPNVPPPTPAIGRTMQTSNPQLEIKSRHGFPGQVGSLALLVRQTQRSLLVSQPSGTYVAIEKDGNQSTVSIVPPRVGFDLSPTSQTPRSNENSYLESLNRAMSFQPVRYSTSDLDPTPGTPSTSQFTGQVGTEVVVFPSDPADPFSADTLCVVTADGTLTFQFPDGTARSADLQVNHQLLHATRIENIIVLCAFDGTTYLVDPTLQAVQIIGAPRTAAFTAGQIGVCPGVSRPCLIYAGFENGIRVVYDRALMSHLAHLGVQRASQAVPEVAHLTPAQLSELIYGVAQQSVE